MPLSPEFHLMQGIIGLPLGIFAVVFAEDIVRGVERRMREGDDSYFEEQRTLRAYPSFRNPRRVRLLGLVLLGLSGYSLWSGLS